MHRWKMNIHVRLMAPRMIWIERVRRSADRFSDLDWLALLNIFYYIKEQTTPSQLYPSDDIIQTSILLATITFLSMCGRKEFSAPQEWIDTHAFESSSSERGRLAQQMKLDTHSSNVASPVILHKGASHFPELMPKVLL